MYNKSSLLFIYLAGILFSTPSIIFASQSLPVSEEFTPPEQDTQQPFTVVNNTYKTISVQVSVFLRDMNFIIDEALLEDSSLSRICSEQIILEPFTNQRIWVHWVDPAAVITMPVLWVEVK